MPYNTFTPPFAPTPGSTNKPKIKLLEAEFGDGYSQSIPDGLNHIRREYSMEWNYLTIEQAEAMVAFFEAQQGCIPFWYTPSNETVPIKWICKDWSDKRDEGGLRTISVKFEQAFIN